MSLKDKLALIVLKYRPDLAPAPFDAPTINAATGLNFDDSDEITEETLKEVERALKQRAEGRKLDANKPRFDLLPFEAIEEVAHVLTYGAKKYAPNNWRTVKGWRWRYCGAALRHLGSYLMGVKFDPESGLPHLAHAACCLLFVLALDKSPEAKEDADVERD